MKNYLFFSVLIIFFNFWTFEEIRSNNLINSDGISFETSSFDTVIVSGEFVNTMLNYSENYFGIRVYNASESSSNDEVGLVLVGVDQNMKDLYSARSLGYYYGKPNESESLMSISRETALTFIGYVQQDVRISSFNSVFTKSEIESAWGENVPNLMYITPNEITVNGQNYPNAQMISPVSLEGMPSNNEIIGAPCPPMCPM